MFWAPGRVAEVRFQAMKDYMKEVLAALDVAARGGLPAPIEPEHSLVLHLGFDSMKMSLLSLALESELGCPIVLDEWIAAHNDPEELTVGSLCRFLQETVAVDERRAVEESSGAVSLRSQLRGDVLFLTLDTPGRGGQRADAGGGVEPARRRDQARSRPRCARSSCGAEASQLHERTGCHALPERQRASSRSARVTAPVREAYRALRACPVPDDRRDRGNCYGCGVELSLQCRYRLACDDRDTRFYMTELADYLMIPISAPPRTTSPARTRARRRLPPLGPALVRQAGFRARPRRFVSRSRRVRLRGRRVRRQARHHGGRDVSPPSGRSGGGPPRRPGTTLDRIRRLPPPIGMRTRPAST